jgi:hypothetical protein
MLWHGKRSVFVDWWIMMADPLSAVFAFLGIFNILDQKTAWVVLAALCTFAIIIRQSQKILSLLIPRLRIACSPDIPLCKLESGDKSYFAYRVRVRNIGRQSVTHCNARLISISKDSRV